MNYTKLIDLYIFKYLYIFFYQIILQNFGQMNLCINPGMINPISIISLILALVSSKGGKLIFYLQ